MNTALRRLVSLLLLLSTVVFAAESIPPDEAANQSDIQPISCWVKFIDQFGTPLSNVVVIGRIRTGGGGGGVSKLRDIPSLRTDTDGVVSVQNERGSFLRLIVEDERYTHGFFKNNALPGMLLRYTPVGGNGSLEHGTESKPVVYCMWRKEGPQSLIFLSGELAFTSEKTVRIDLVKGSVVDTGGDILVKCEMPDDLGERMKQADGRGFFPYEVSVEVIEGSYSPLDENVGIPEFQAIPGVVVDDFSTSVIKGQPGMGHSLEKPVSMRGFLKLRRGGAYGKVRIFIGVEPFDRSGHGRLYIRIDEALLNLSGSRSFEPDPAKLTKLTLTDARKKPEPEPKKP